MAFLWKYLTCPSLPDVSDEVLRNVEFVCDVLTGVDLPGDAELDKAEDAGGALARGAAHLPSGLANINPVKTVSKVQTSFNV